MKLVVGLGNPGEKYLNTRHNLGFDVLDEFKRKKELGNWSLETKFKAQVIKSGDLILARPQTFMNQSGLCVATLAKFYKIKPEDIIIIHDELDIVLGHLKIRVGGSDAGHHGIESIITHLGSENFVRVRLGIGNLKSQSGEHKHRAFNAEHFVTEDFLPNEKSKAKALIKKGVKALETILEKGVEKAQNQYNQQ